MKKSEPKSKNAKLLKPLKLWANPEDLKNLRAKTGHVILLTKAYRGGGPMATTQKIFLHENKP